MNTPNFDKIATNKKYERLIGKKNDVRNWFGLIGSLALGMWLSYVLALYINKLGDYDKDFKREPVVLETIGSIQLGGMLGLLVLGIMFRVLNNDIEKEEKKNAKARKMFLDKIVNEYDIKDFDAAKNLGEYLLSYMGTKDKQKIADAYEKLDLDDSKAVDKFVELVRGIVTEVIDNYPETRTKIPAIAEGKTFMFNGWGRVPKEYGGK